MKKFIPPNKFGSCPYTEQEFAIDFSKKVDFSGTVKHGKNLKPKKVAPRQAER